MEILFLLIVAIWVAMPDKNGISHSRQRYEITETLMNEINLNKQKQWQI